MVSRPKASRAKFKKDSRPEVAPLSQLDFPIVGVGGSAGGIEAFIDLLKSLPEHPGLAFIFVLHQDPRHESNLAQVLKRATGMPVEVIQNGTRVQRDRVYVAPPGSEVSIEAGVLHLHDQTAGAPSSVDAFFRSLAEDQSERAIAVVLSGSASDGTMGTREVKGEGGITFAQDESAKMHGMPQSAIAGGFIDFVLPPAGIAEELVRFAGHEYIRGRTPRNLPVEELQEVFSLLVALHNTDFSKYKPTTIERRIRRRMAVRRTEVLADYLRILRVDPQEVEQLYGDILIKVTAFFRDPQVFATLQSEVLPEVLRSRKQGETIRAWVPGCAMGEEVYSIALALLEAIEASASTCEMQIFGTDISDAAVARARMGLYPESIAADVSEERLQKFFTKFEGGYRISKAIRDSCVFARQNVVKDPPFSKLDLISCRNVMIYFGSGLQRRVMSIFNYALRPDGFLILGSSETIGSFGDLFAVYDSKHKVYRKKTTIVRPSLEFDMDNPQKNSQRAPAEGEGAVPSSVFREADRVLLTHFSPPGVLISENLEVLQFRGKTSRYLELPTGTATFNLLKMARDGLLTDLRAAIQAARKKDGTERREGIRVKTNGGYALVDIEVIPFIGASKERFLVVLFEEHPPDEKNKRRGKLKKAAVEEAAEPRSAGRLKQELQATREYLQSIIEEQEATNEELRAASEEIQSSNEELQSTNEELETAKEELQSSNEELQTLNEELENRNQELAVANNDLMNLLTSVEIPILMLDGNLRIRRFNPIAQRKLNLVAADVGRPLSDINTKLKLDTLDEMVREVLETLEVKEVELRDRQGHLQSLRIRPYRTTDNKIDGAVLVLVDLDEFARRIAVKKS